VALALDGTALWADKVRVARRFAARFGRLTGVYEAGRVLLAVLNFAAHPDSRLRSGQMLTIIAPAARLVMLRAPPYVVHRGAQ
jgi:hypothetical protein